MDRRLLVGWSGSRSMDLLCRVQLGDPGPMDRRLLVGWSGSRSMDLKPADLERRLAVGIMERRVALGIIYDRSPTCSRRVEQPEHGFKTSRLGAPSCTRHHRSPTCSRRVEQPEHGFKTSRLGAPTCTRHHGAPTCSRHMIDRRLAVGGSSSQSMDLKPADLERRVALGIIYDRSPSCTRRVEQPEHGFKTSRVQLGDPGPMDRRLAVGGSSSRSMDLKPADLERRVALGIIYDRSPTCSRRVEQPEHGFKTSRVQLGDPSRVQLGDPSRVQLGDPSRVQLGDP